MTGASGPDPVDAPDPVDVHVGRRLRLARVATGWSRADLVDRLGADRSGAERPGAERSGAERSGIDVRGLADLETGRAAISAGGLHRLAALFEVSIQYFFDGLAQPSRQAGPERRGAAPEADPQLLRLVGAYHGIADEELRAALVDLVARMPGGLTRSRRRSARILRFEPPRGAD